MRKELNPTMTSVLVGVAVVVIGLVFYFLFNPIHTLPPPPTKRGNTPGPALPAGPPPADQIRHGPVGS